MQRAEEAAKVECDPYGDGKPKHRGPRCRELEGIERDKRAEFAAIVAGLATARAASDLDKKIAEARERLEQVDLRTASTETDAQSAAFAKITGTDKSLAAAAGHVLFALGIEFGSGLGFWLVFGHGGSSQREGLGIWSRQTWSQHCQVRWPRSKPRPTRLIGFSASVFAPPWGSAFAPLR